MNLSKLWDWQIPDQIIEKYENLIWNWEIWKLSNYLETFEVYSASRSWFLSREILGLWREISKKARKRLKSEKMGFISQNSKWRVILWELNKLNRRARHSMMPFLFSLFENVLSFLKLVEYVQYVPLFSSQRKTKKKKREKEAI